MTRRLIRLADTNAPRHTVNKPHIVAPALQARLLTETLTRARVDHCGLAEAHTDLLSAVRRTRWAGAQPWSGHGYAVTRARANDVFPATRIGNATLSLADSRHGWDRLDKFNLALGSGEDTLNTGVVLSRRRQDDQHLTTLSSHLWSRPAASDAEWAAGAATLREYGETVEGAVAVLADFNRGKAIVAKHFPARAGWRIAAFQNVTGVLVRGLDPRNERAITRGWVPQGTDHREGLIVAACSATDTRTPDRLPR